MFPFFKTPSKVVRKIFFQIKKVLQALIFKLKINISAGLGSYQNTRQNSQISLWNWKMILNLTRVMVPFSVYIYSHLKNSLTVSSKFIDGLTLS